MKYLYLDSSILVSLVLGDPRRSPPALRAIKVSDEVGTSALSLVECQAGLSAQLAHEPNQLAAAEQNLNQLLARLTLYSVERTVLMQARILVKRHRSSLGLRSLDAIHLATVVLIQGNFSEMEDFAFEYMTADRKQHAAFTAEGLRGKFLD